MTAPLKAQHVQDVARTMDNMANSRHFADDAKDQFAWTAYYLREIAACATDTAVNTERLEHALKGLLQRPVQLASPATPTEPGDVFVVAAGNAFTGVMLYGPFTCDEAEAFEEQFESCDSRIVTLYREIPKQVIETPYHKLRRLAADTRRNGGNLESLEALGQFLEEHP